MQLFYSVQIKHIRHKNCIQDLVYIFVPNICIIFSFIHKLTHIWNIIVNNEENAPPRSGSTNIYSTGWWLSDLQLHPLIVDFCRDLMMKGRDAQGLFCTNIQREVFAEEIIYFFESFCGKVLRLRVFENRHYPTCAAFVEFSTPPADGIYSSASSPSYQGSTYSPAAPYPGVAVCIHYCN
ncbi:hypothetical protein ACET3Z_006079 [Daucus carota]